MRKRVQALPLQSFACAASFIKVNREDDDDHHDEKDDDHYEYHHHHYEDDDDQRQFNAGPSKHPGHGLVYVHVKVKKH